MDSKTLLSLRLLLLLLPLLVLQEGQTAEFGDRGAKVPYVRYEAEAGGVTGGKILAANRSVGDLAGEASGRQAVKLEASGDGVQWKVLSAANSLVLRYSIPDSADGKGSEASLSVYVNDVKKGSLTLTSKYSWLYGSEADPQNNPSLGTPRHIYDEVHLLFDFTLQAGDRIALKKEASDTAAFYGIDFVELEMVEPPKTCPPDFVDAAAEGITPENFSEKFGALVQACTFKPEYKGKKGIFIPAGRYKLDGQVLMNTELPPGFAIMGAGMWYTVIYSDDGGDKDWGAPAFNLNGRTLQFSDFAMFGASRTRTGSGKPFVNAYGDGTIISRIWVEHMTCGFWVGGISGRTNNLLIDSCRLRNLGADGINLCNGTKNSRVLNTTVRNSGDDGIAIWSAPEFDGPAGGIDYPGCANNIVDHCTVELTWRANAFAIYGGKDNVIKNSVARDTLTYAGVNVSSTFNPREFSGVTRVENMLLERCGGSFWNGIQFGALWVMADTQAMSGIEFKDIEIIDPTFSGILLKSETYQQPGREMQVSFENVSVTRPGTAAIFIVDGMGSATFKNSKIDLAGQPGPAVVISKDNNGKTGTGLLKLSADESSVGFPK